MFQRQFKRKMIIYFEFIPQIIFITFIFVYLCFMIIVKWLKYSGSDDPVTGTCGPQLLIELIGMFSLSDNAIDTKGNYDPCKRLYTGQVII